jgi:hypothetical protein
MKFFLLAVVCTTLCMGVYAQTSDEEAQAIINLMGVQKKQVIAKLVHVPAKDSAQFWHLYNEYQQKTTAVAKSRYHLYESTINAYANMTDKAADSLAGQYFKNRMAQEQMLEEYFKKIKTAVNATTAFEFYQAEVYMLTAVRAHIMSQIPTFSEFRAAVEGKH